MKTKEKDMLKLMVAFVAMMLAILMLTSVSTKYTRKGCTVVEVIGNDNYAVDAHGNEWVFAGTGYRVGEQVDLRMDDNGTETIKDDKVIKAIK